MPISAAETASSLKVMEASSGEDEG
jgi:hypothetical protein